jgi:hypothetical protein
VNGRSGVGFGGVHPQALFIPSCPGINGLTGDLHRTDQCKPFVGFASGELLGSCVFGLCCCWSVLTRFGVVLLGFEKGSYSFVLRMFLFQVLEKSLRLSERLLCSCCSHRPDRLCPPV